MCTRRESAVDHRFDRSLYVRAGAGVPLITCSSPPVGRLTKNQYATWATTAARAPTAPTTSSTNVCWCHRLRCRNKNWSPATWRRCRPASSISCAPIRSIRTQYRCTRYAFDPVRPRQRLRTEPNLIHLHPRTRMIDRCLLCVPHGVRSQNSYRKCVLHNVLTVTVPNSFACVPLATLRSVIYSTLSSLIYVLCCSFDVCVCVLRASSFGVNYIDRTHTHTHT